MQVRFAAWVLPLALLGVFALLVSTAGPAVADHAYSHRYIVSGRIVDQLGDPVKGIQVTVTLPSGMVPEGACTLEPVTQSATDGWGDYYYCFHIHTFSASGSIAVQARGQSYTAPPDPGLRKSVVNIQLTDALPDADKDLTIKAAFHKTYTVRGRVWQPQVGAVVEGINVEGIALESVGVHNVLRSNVGPLEQHAVTNNYGDYSARFSAGATVSSGEVTATYGSTTQSASVNTLFMVSDIDLIVPPTNPVVDAFVAAWPFIAGAGIFAAVAIVAVRYAPKRARVLDVSRVPGIGRSKAAQLRSAGISTVPQLAQADPKGIAERTSISQKEAKRLIRKAKELLTTRAEAEATETGD